jgi:hypothetical protein
MTDICTLRGQQDVPMAWIWRRPLDPAGEPSGPWVRVGYTCEAGTTAAGPSLADVRRAFRHVPFAKPRLTVQPDGWTLVNLDTYYAITWSSRGVRPREVTTVQLLGHEVAIRPKIVRYEYHFGDSSTQRSSDPGGPYPEGIVRHRYQARGNLTIHATARYTADFSVDGGGFQGLDDTIDIPGPSRPLQVYEARAQLVPDTGTE